MHRQPKPAANVGHVQQRIMHGQMPQDQPGIAFVFRRGPRGLLQSITVWMGGVVVSKERSWNFFLYVHSCTMMSLFSLPATHEISFHNGILLDPPHYDNTPDHCTVAHCPRSGACAAPPPPTRPWRSRQRRLGGIGSGGQYFAANRSKGPSDCHRSNLCQSSGILSSSDSPITC